MYSNGFYWVKNEATDGSVDWRVCEHDNGYWFFTANDRAYDADDIKDKWTVHSKINTPDIKPHGRRSELTNALLALAVGKSIRIDPISPERLQTVFGRCRVISKNAGLRLQAYYYPKYVTVERVEDWGNLITRHKLSPITLEIAKMNIGESKISDSIDGLMGTGKGALQSHHKVKARQLLQSLNANWKCETVSDRVKITRVS
jgi:hypothetical protein